VELYETLPNFSVRGQSDTWKYLGKNEKCEARQKWTLDADL